MTKVRENQQVAKSDKQNGFTTVDINRDNLPDLGKAGVFPVDLMSDYWTPEQVGESKRVYFDKISTRQVKDQQTEEILELECAFFLEQTEEGVQTISNGSKRLVGALENFQIERGTPLQITYKGKKRNRTNQYQSDNWSIKILTLNIK